MARIQDRKGLHSLISSVNESNRDYYSRFGNWVSPQIKVFWLEVNQNYNVEEKLGLEPLDRNLFELVVEDDIFWVDTTNPRIWEIYTLSSTRNTEKKLIALSRGIKGVDKAWFTQSFMRRIQKEMGFSDRGFGIKYRDLLSNEKDTNNFSAKFWFGRRSLKSMEPVLDNLEKSFSISSIRFGKNISCDERNLTGQLYEFYYNGHLTVTTCDDTEEMFNLISMIRDLYLENLVYLEKENKRKPALIEVTFSEEIDRDGFDVLTQVGKRDLNLWLQPYHSESDMNRYCGVDMHTGDFINLDLGNDYSYISADKNSCMNVAPRFGTLSARYLSTSTNIYHDGVELFV
ncbi:MAG TPA: hypothetical protein ENK47_02360 [Euryarchaeota archaeon]|nr:hypothetical protein [Euryarchaeota archaeon]